MLTGQPVETGHSLPDRTTVTPKLTGKDWRSPERKHNQTAENTVFQGDQRPDPRTRQVSSGSNTDNHESWLTTDYRQWPTILNQQGPSQCLSDFFADADKASPDPFGGSPDNQDKDAQDQRRGSNTDHRPFTDVQTWQPGSTKLSKGRLHCLPSGRRESTDKDDQDQRRGSNTDHRPFTDVKDWTTRDQHKTSAHSTPILRDNTWPTMESQTDLCLW